ncbi:MAG: tRNA (adenosine(37)-N6)-threonylcarbamoyltransferase complex ATPase subunit type 1 TsaE [Thiotrichales bacterium]|nr:MAG: tRNA (adenosine(37)-N6)-threonylcarbamoyltransferase complex ATPase subunit type 1 TsaE [Thiotrichales bacterium]PCI12349.1 MAG: tRNA (adenosine(37)-N6)-threonylcarbamoyltransferase complex ATPase subunit type 1 TsaE [Thiotrichales bacterium]
MEALGATFASVMNGGGVVFLHGPLGAGKTTWTRGFLHARGHVGAVKSPTYTLVESYPLIDGMVHHFDLYRLGDPEELEYMGIRDYFSDDMLCLVEWPERGLGVIGKADIELTLSYRDSERELSVCVVSEKGRKMIQQMK